MTKALTGALDYLPGAESFLDPDRQDADRPQDARAVIIPFGLEASVSYGSGTKAGPAAILAASHQLELYDEELGREAYLDYGIAAVREPQIPRDVPAALTSLPVSLKRCWLRIDCPSCWAASMR